MDPLTLYRVAYESIGPLFAFQWVGLVGSFVLSVPLGFVLARGLRWVGRWLARRSQSRIDDEIVEAAHLPLRYLCMVGTFHVLHNEVLLPAPLLASLAALLRALSIACLGWFLIRALHAAASSAAQGGIGRDTADPQRLARTRAMRTQVIVINRIVSVLVFIIGGAMVALQFSAVRSVGVSLLASAGVAGIVLGLAAQKSLGALLAGIQLSLSQPIRIGDSVVLEGEYGTIEDIGLTYVSVRLWDERRLIVPTPRFLEGSFQNWSRTTNGLLGTVLFRADFELPVDAARAELERILAGEPLWDGRVRKVQVTEANDRSVELRVLLSATSPDALWELRVSVREKMVKWLQNEARSYLPRSRVVGPGAAAVDERPSMVSRSRAAQKS